MSVIFFPMLKENVVVVKTVENEEGAHNFQTACQSATSPLRENKTDEKENQVTVTTPGCSKFMYPLLNDQGERALYQPVRRETAPVKKQLKSC